MLFHLSTSLPLTEEFHLRDKASRHLRLPEYAWETTINSSSHSCTFRLAVLSLTVFIPRPRFVSCEPNGLLRNVRHLEALELNNLFLSVSRQENISCKTSSLMSIAPWNMRLIYIVPMFLTFHWHKINALIKVIRERHIAGTSESVKEIFRRQTETSREVFYFCFERRFARRYRETMKSKQHLSCRAVGRVNL